MLHLNILSTHARTLHTSRENIFSIEHQPDTPAAASCVHSHSCSTQRRSLPQLSTSNCCSHEAYSSLHSVLLFLLKFQIFTNSAHRRRSGLFSQLCLSHAASMISLCFEDGVLARFRTRNNWLCSGTCYRIPSALSHDAERHKRCTWTAHKTAVTPPWQDSRTTIFSGIHRID